jgi:hypothetical protein
MPTVSVTGTGPYTVVADEYKFVLAAASTAFTEFYLLKSSTPTTNLGGLTRFCVAVIDTVTYDLTSAGVLSLEENTPARVVIKHTGDLKPTAGGTTKGTATIYIVCYPDRIDVYSVYNFTSGTAIEARPWSPYWLSSAVWDTYAYTSTLGGTYTVRDPAGTATVATAAGPWAIAVANTAGDYEFHAAIATKGGYGNLVLVETDNGTNMILTLRQQSLATGTNYKAALEITFFPTAVGPPPDYDFAFDNAGGKARRYSYLDPDNLDASADDGTVVYGTLKTNDTYDIDADGFSEGEGAFTVTAAANRVEVKLNRAPGVAGQKDFFYPAVKAFTVTGDLSYAKSSTNGSDWTTLSAGTDYNVQTSGANRVFEYLHTFNVPLWLDLLWGGSAAQVTQTLRGRWGMLAAQGSACLRGRWGSAASKGIQALRGRFAIPTLSQGIQAIRSRWRMGSNAVTQTLRGRWGFLRTLTHRLEGLWRIAATTAVYALYRGVDTEPDLAAAPWETFAALPHTTAALGVSHTYYFVLRRFNDYGLHSWNDESWTVTIAADGTQVVTAPSAPEAFVVDAAAGGKARARAKYIYGTDGDDQADKWLVYSTSDGDDPVPGTDVPAIFTMLKRDGVAKLDWLSAAFADGTVVKVLLRTRRSGTGGADSASTAILSVTADTDGPAAPAPATAAFGTQGTQG